MACSKPQRAAIPRSGVALLEVPDLTLAEEIRAAQAVESGCACGTAERTGQAENAYRLEVKEALQQLEVLRSLGPFLSYAPWLMEIHHEAYRTVDRWIRDGEQEGGPGPVGCGTDIRASLPFDPNRIAWHRWFSEAWTGAAGSPGAKRAARDAAWLVWPPDRSTARSTFADNGSGDDDAPQIPLPPPIRPPHRTPSAPSVASREDLSCERFIRKFSLSRSGEVVGIDETEASVSAVDSGTLIGAVVESPGLRVARDLDDRFNRPLLRLLCDYLQDYYLRLEELALEVPRTSPAFPDIAATLSGVFPFEPAPSGDFARRAWTGYPSAPGGPAPQAGISYLAFPQAPDILNSTSNDSRWLRIHDHIFVLSASEPAPGGIAFNGAVDGTLRPPSRAAEADTIGLAIRLLERSLPELRSWEEPITDRTGARFDWPIAVPVGSDMVSAMEAWYSPGSQYTLQIVLRGDAIFNPDAGGLGWAPNATVFLSRTKLSGGVPVQSTEFSVARRALDALREQAVKQFLSSGAQGPNEPVEIEPEVVRALADALTTLSGLLLHESGHVLSFQQFGVGTGIANDWYDGPGYRDFDAITAYQMSPGSSVVDLDYFDSTDFPMIVDANLLTYLGMLAVLLPWAVNPILPLLMAAPPIIANHYVLTLYAVWWECLLRQNRGPLNALQNQACRCDLDGSGDVDTVLLFPLEVATLHQEHWGWRTWNLDGSRPCDEVPLPENGEEAPNRWNCMCNQLNCQCGDAPGSTVPRLWCP